MAAPGDEAFGWHIKNDADVGFAIEGLVREVAAKQMADLADLFPFRETWKLSARFEDNWFACRLKDENRGGVPFIGTFTPEEWSALTGLVVPFQRRNHSELAALVGDGWISDRSFFYAGPHKDRHAIWPDLQRHVVDWLNQRVVSSIVELNRRRIVRVLGDPPAFDIDSVSSACWVIECEETCSQGSGFALEKIGLVTCAHVLGSHSFAFQTSNINKRFPLEVVSKHDVVDLAIAKLPVPGARTLAQGSADKWKLQDHIAIAGFPNYRLGDSVQFRTGNTTGFRQISGIRRALTNAGIIRGNSGGPVLGPGNRVIGVAVTGGDNVVEAERTEDQGIVPIDALSFLSASS